MSFLPPDYAPPQSGNYMRLQVGDNRIRVLGSAVVGNEFWTTDDQGNRKPVRRRMHETIYPDELGVDQYGKQERPRHFWAFPVWNYQAKQVQILEVTQKTVQDAILALAESADWGDPKGYDLLIRKQGSGLETEYTVMPGKPGDPPVEAQREYVRLNIDMEALFEGGDPFAGAGDEPAAQQSNADPSPHPDIVSARIANVTTKPTAKGTLYEVATTMGGFATLDEAVGKQAQELAGSDTNVELTVTDTGKGKRLDRITVPEGSHAPMVEDDIPF